MLPDSNTLFEDLLIYMASVWVIIDRFCLRFFFFSFRLPHRFYGFVFVFRLTRAQEATPSFFCRSPGDYVTSCASRHRLIISSIGESSVSRPLLELRLRPSAGPETTGIFFSPSRFLSFHHHHHLLLLLLLL